MRISFYRNIFYFINFVRKTRLSVFICIFGLAFYGQDILSKGIVYIYCECDSVWGNNEQSKGHYIHEMRDGLKRLGYKPIITCKLDGLENFDKLILFSVVGPWAINSIKKYPKEKILAFLWEPPVVSPDNYEDKFYSLFSKIFTMDDDLVDNNKFIYVKSPNFTPMIDKIVQFNEKKLCIMMNNNKDSSHKYSLYGERRKVINFFEQNHNQDFDLYGGWWDGLGLKTYKGYVNSKFDCMKYYRFCYAYENMHNIKGYITEKMFDTLSVGCVPVYWGAQNVTDYIPKNCFIDRRDFSGDEQLYQFLKNMKEKEYKIYIDNIKSFLNSEQALVFSHERLVDIFLDTIEPGYDKNIALTESYRGVLARLYKYLGKKI